MAKTPKIRLIREKRRVLEDEIAQLRLEIAEREALVAEKETQAKHMEIAETVLASLADDEEPEVIDPGSLAPAEGEARRRVKPTDIPTLSSMILTVLAEAREKGKKGLRPTHIAEVIADRWWPEANSTNVASVAWRMAKSKKLNKKGALYCLREEGSAVPTAEPSSTEGVAGSPGSPTKAASVGSTPTTSSSLRRDLFGSASPAVVVSLTERRFTAR
jgi:hypothetical protein